MLAALVIKYFVTNLKSAITEKTFFGRIPLVEEIELAIQRVADCRYLGLVSQVFKIFQNFGENITMTFLYIRYNMFFRDCTRHVIHNKYV